MSEVGTNCVADAALRARKEQLHTTMLIELLALLIFMAFAFAFTLKEEGERLNPWKQKHDKVVAELKIAQARVRKLESDIRLLNLKVETLEASLRLFATKYTGTLRPNDRIVPLPQPELDKLLNDKALLEALQAENARLRAQLKGGGTDRPNCLVTPGFLISVELLSTGNLHVKPAWAATASAKVADVDGALDLGRGGTMSPSQFLAKAAVVDRWARAQAQPCGFRARVSESHGNLALYKRQVRTVEQYFYVRRE